MRRIKHIIAAIIITGVAYTSAQAQNFDANRMNRDLRILENVLEEFFKTGALRSSSGSLYLGRNEQGIKGTYLPDYGVIFMIPRPEAFGGIVIREGMVDEDTKKKLNEVYSFYYGGDGAAEDEEITEENIEKRIREFLRDYSATIGQLKNNEKVLVIYGANTSNRRNTIFGRRANDFKVDNPLDEIPIISVVADKKDIEDYRSGRINESTFNNKIDVSKSEKKEYLDLKVLGNIFETALEEGEGYEFHITTRGALSYLYMENFGALYTINVHLGHNNGLNGAVTVLGYQTSVSSAVEIDSLRSIQYRKEKERNEAIKTEYDALVKKTKEFIVDYARTVSTVKSDQYLLVTLNIQNRLKDIPERVDFQIKRSVLDDLDKGKLNRDAAINKVTVREF